MCGTAAVSKLHISFYKANCYGFYSYLKSPCWVGVMIMLRVFLGVDEHIHLMTTQADGEGEGGPITV